MEVWEPKSEVRDFYEGSCEYSMGVCVWVWELKGEVWDLSSHQLPLNLTPANSHALTFDHKRMSPFGGQWQS